MNVFELTLDIAAKFDQVAQTEQGEKALDYASDCVEDWGGLAAQELQRRAMTEIFKNMNEEDLMTMILNDEYQIDFNKLAWEAVKKARNIQ
ncbi:MAG: hypothetical protein VXW65_03765 [Pseudomonadota bacterium]|nr:hypothetical protein [Pseudomonadota bacterium]